MLFRLENIPSKGGLGLSLGGNGGKNDKVFIVDIKSTSPLPLIPGDELLEVIISSEQKFVKILFLVHNLIFLYLFYVKLIDCRCQHYNT
jgi:hypothetical protein